MSESKPIPGTPLSPETIERISGGCTASELVELSRNLTEAYENLIDFTSHVIERVAG